MLNNPARLCTHQNYRLPQEISWNFLTALTRLSNAAQLLSIFNFYWAPYEYSWKFLPALT